jgi:hypothetical protein
MIEYPERDAAIGCGCHGAESPYATPVNRVIDLRSDPGS